MIHMAEWSALSSRINGLMRAATLDAQYQVSRSSTGRAKGLGAHTGRVFYALRDFQERFQQVLPPPARDAVVRFIDDAAPLIETAPNSRGMAHESFQQVILLLAALESEVSYLLSDNQELVHSLCERAFNHLQRSIVVDDELRTKWHRAFQSGEVACEKLGAIHLLLHGISAFKVHSSGARTDLVFQEPFDHSATDHRYAEGLVLTEWKKARDSVEAERRFKEGRQQAHNYAKGALAGTELTGYRYVVVVSEQQVAVPDDIFDDGVLYRHINVAVSPLPPSRV